MASYRDRFINTMLFKGAGQVPRCEVALWGQTIDRWKNEGAPEEAFEHDGFFMLGNKHFGFEPKIFIDIHAQDPFPAFEKKVIEEDARYIIYTDSHGVTHKALKEGEAHGTRMCMDQYIGFPVTDRKSFGELKKRFNAETGNRYPESWGEKTLEWEKRDCPLCLTRNGDFGFYSILRSYMGTEGVSYIFYDDPGLAHEMLDFFCEYIIELTHKALHETNCDYFNFWEDMSFKNGPLVSPECFRTFFLPRYKRLVGHLRAHGVEIVTVDTDGDPGGLIPLFLEAGVNGLWPIEIAAGLDPAALRKEYGSDLALIGGIDKRILAASKNEIDYEVNRVLDFMLPRGGYIPTVDHSVPPDVPYENFLHYLTVKNKLLG